MKRCLVTVFACAAVVLGASGCGDDSESSDDNVTVSSTVGTEAPSSAVSTTPVPQSPAPAPSPAIEPPPAAEPPPVAEPPAEEPAPQPPAQQQAPVQPEPAQPEPAQPEPTLTLPDFDPQAGY